MPDYLELARIISSNPVLALETMRSGLKDDSPATLAALLQPLLPYLTYPTLLHLASAASDGLSAILFPGSSADKSDHLSNVIDLQRDFVGSAGCEARYEDDYLVDVFGPNGGQAWGAMRTPDAFKLTPPSGLLAIVKGAKLEAMAPCESFETFKKELDAATAGLLAKVDFSNICLGGGLVLGLLTGQLSSTAYEGSDCDLFLYGLQPNQLIAKTRKIIEEIRSALPDELKPRLLLIKGFNAITLLAPCNEYKKKRVIQIILKSNASIFEAIASFDLDACCVAFTGNAVVAAPRAARSLALGNWGGGGINLLDVRLCRSRDPTASTFGMRSVKKYQPRGFGLAVSKLYINTLALNDVNFEKEFSDALRKAKKGESLQQLKGIDAVLGRMAVRGHVPTRAAGKKVAPKSGLLYDDDDEDGDYGPFVGPGFSLKTWFTIPSTFRGDPGWIRREVWEHNTRMGDAISLLIRADSPTLSKPLRSYELATWNTPYLASFDSEQLLGLKTVPARAEANYRDMYFDWPDGDDYIPSIANVQYLAKVPNSLVALADACKPVLEELGRGPLPAPQKKQRADEPTFTTDQKTKIQVALSILTSSAELFHHADHIHPTTTTVDELAVPLSLLTPFRPVGDGLPKVGKAIISTLSGMDGKPEAVSKSSSPSQYVVMVEAG
ncbi:hypothetical protein RQP46_010520 [Phenoliferia psychrophenolica]